MPLPRSLQLILFAAVAVLVAAGPASAAARKPVTRGSTYLALGDSVTFGYQEATVVPAPGYSRAANFTGYAELIRAGLRLRVFNAACPGETSASFINASAQSNGCESAPPGSTAVAYRQHFPLHVRYSGSQLAYAVKFLRKHRHTRLVSLMIGANDLFLCQRATADACGSAAEQGATLSTVTANVRRILSAIRRKAHYRGQLALVDYYALDYTSPALVAFSAGLNRAMANGARGFGVVTADGFGLFRAAALHSGGGSCTAGLLTQLGRPDACGVHPSYAGQGLLAHALLRAIRL